MIPGKNQKVTEKQQDTVHTIVYNECMFHRLESICHGSLAKGIRAESFITGQLTFQEVTRRLAKHLFEVHIWFKNAGSICWQLPAHIQ